MKYIRLPDGTVEEIPDNVSDEVVQKAIADAFPDYQPQQQVAPVEEDYGNQGVDYLQLGLKGAYQTVADPLKFAARLLPEDAQESVTSALDAPTQFLDERIDPEVANSFGGQVAQGMGNVGGLLIPGTALLKAGGKAAAMAGTTSLSTLGGGERQVADLEDTMERRGLEATTEQYLKAGAGGLAIGASETLLPAALGKFAPARLTDWFDAGGYFSRAGKAGVLEAGQEGGAELAGNAVAWSVYDETRDLIEGTGESAAVGGTVGVIMAMILPGKQNQEAFQRLTDEDVAFTPEERQELVDENIQRVNDLQNYFNEGLDSLESQYEGRKKDAPKLYRDLKTLKNLDILIRRVEENIEVEQNDTAKQALIQERNNLALEYGNKLEEVINTPEVSRGLIERGLIDKRDLKEDPNAIDPTDPELAKEYDLLDKYRKMPDDEATQGLIKEQERKIKKIQEAKRQEQVLDTQIERARKAGDTDAVEALEKKKLKTLKKKDPEAEQPAKTEEELKQEEIDKAFEKAERETKLEEEVDKYTQELQAEIEARKQKEIDEANKAQQGLTAIPMDEEAKAGDPIDFDDDPVVRSSRQDFELADSDLTQAEETLRNLEEAKAPADMIKRQKSKVSAAKAKKTKITNEAAKAVQERNEALSAAKRIRDNPNATEESLELANELEQRAEQAEAKYRAAIEKREQSIDEASRKEQQAAQDRQTQAESEIVSQEVEAEDVVAPGPAEDITLADEGTIDTEQGTQLSEDYTAEIEAELARERKEAADRGLNVEVTEQSVEDIVLDDSFEVTDTFVNDVLKPASKKSPNFVLVGKAGEAVANAYKKITGNSLKRRASRDGGFLVPKEVEGTVRFIAASAQRRNAGKRLSPSDPIVGEQRQKERRGSKRDRVLRRLDNIDEALDEAGSQMPHLKPIIASIKKRLKDFSYTVKVVNELGARGDIAASVDPVTGKNKYTIRLDSIKSGGETLAHELDHALILNQIDGVERGLITNKSVVNAVNKLKDIYQAAKKTAPNVFSDTNAFDNIQEFITWSRTNAQMQDYLDTLRYDNRSAWDVIVDVFNAITGRVASSKNRSALQSVLRESRRIEDAGQVNRRVGEELERQRTDEALPATGEMIAGPRMQSEEAQGTFVEAEQMDLQGVDREAIRRKTGWWKGPDNKWRYELDDSKASLNSGAKLSYFDPLLLKDLLKHPELFSAYPQLADYRIFPLSLGQALGGVNGSFDPDTKELRLSTILLTNKPDEARKALLHEVQHAVQDIEGRQAGGNSGMFATPEYNEIKDRDFYKELTEIAENESSEIESGVEGALRKAFSDAGVDVNESDLRQAVESSARSFSNPFTILGQLERVLKRAGVRVSDADARKRFEDSISESVPSLVKDNKSIFKLEFTRLLKDKKDKMSDKQYNDYLRLLGESEARQTADRADMDWIKRYEESPIDSYDRFKEDELIMQSPFDTGEISSESPIVGQQKSDNFETDQTRRDMSNAVQGDRIDVTDRDFIESVNSKFLGVDSISDVLKRTEITRPLGEAIDKWVDLKGKYQGKFNAKAQEVLEEYYKGSLFDTKKDKQRNIDAFIAEYYGALQQGKENLAQRYLQTYPEYAGYVRRMDEAFKMMADEARRVGLKVKVGKRWVPFNPRKDYFPLVINDKVKDALRSKAKGKPNKDYYDLLNSLAATYRNKTQAEAMRLAQKKLDGLQAEMANPDAQSVFGNIERQRVDMLPLEFYDMSMDTFTRYGEAWAERIAQIESFGQGDADLFDSTMAKSGNAETQMYIDKVKKSVYRKDTDDWFNNKIINVLGTLATGLQLSNPASAATNIAGGSVLTQMYFGSRTTGKAMADLFSDYSNLSDLAVELGVVKKDFINIINDSVNSGALASNITSNLLKIGGFNLAEKNARLLALSAARRALLDAQNGIRPERFKSMLKRHGMDQSVLLDPNHPKHQEQYQAYLRKMVGVTQGSYDMDRVPYWVNSNMGRFLFKYSKFSTQVMRMQRELYSDLWNKSATPAERAEAATRLAKNIGVIGVVGGTVGFALEEAFNRLGLDDPTILEMFEKLFGEDEEKGKETYDTLMDAADYMMGSMYTLGLFGMPGTYIEMGHRYIEAAQRGQITAPTPPAPPLALIESAGRAFMSGKAAFEQGGSAVEIADSIIKPLANSIGAVRGYAQITGRGIQMAGDMNLIDTQLTYAFKNDKKWAQQAVRRYEDSTGYERRFSGGSKNSLRNASIEDKILSNRAELAVQEIQKELREQRTLKDRKRVIAGIKQSMLQRHPWAVYGESKASSAAERELFRRWAESNLSEYEYKRLLKIGKDYESAMNRLPAKYRPDFKRPTAQELREAIRRQQDDGRN